MTTFNKIIKIPNDRRLSLDFELPNDIPTGTANLQLTITPEEESPKQAWDTLMEFYGCMKDEPAFQGNSVEIQRKMRDE
jgi:hypothetical protein